MPALALILTGAWLLDATAADAAPRPSRSYREWAAGPVRWLMLPEEERAFRRLRDDTEAARFVRDFWRRRDPDPETPGNPFHDRFELRVADADRLYPEGSRRGSLTDRGQALILLGPPPRLRVAQQTAPVWTPQRSGRNPGFTVRQVRVEIWEYDRDVWPELAVLLERDNHDAAALTFVIEDDRAELVEGEELLELAALASVGPGG